MSTALAQKPAHVAAELVFDFDYHKPPGHEQDVHLAWKRLHDGPDIFWSPHYGGHWVATRADDIDVMQTDHARFSYRHVTIPVQEGLPPLAPLEYDPPEHGPLRNILSPAFGPKPVRSLEGDLRALSSSLLDKIVPVGACDFVEAYAKQLPIVTFLRLVDLPLEDRETLLDLTEKSVRPKSDQDRMIANVGLQAYLGKWVMERQLHPGKDLISRMVNAKIGDAPIGERELAGMIPTVIFGGLDTVASALSFTARCLAERPDLRRQLSDNAESIPAAIEEFLRRFGIPNTARVVVADMDYKGVKFLAGEQILLPKALHGLDERRFEKPLDVSFSRTPQAHAAFGDGPHRCPGAQLARLEMRVFLEQWLERIPEFHITPGGLVRTSSGPVNGVLSLPLSWAVGS